MPLYVLFKLVLLLAVVSKSYSHLDRQENYLVCRPLDTLFKQQSSCSSSNQSTIRGPPGRSGKRGPQGLKGATGPAGPPGPQPLVNWTRIEHHIQELVHGKQVCTGVVYRSHCYWLPWLVATTSNGGKSAAANVCASYGATLVDIESSEMYDLLYKYIKKAWIKYVDQPTFDYADVWLASSYKSGNAVSSKGGDVYLRWYSGYPSSGTGMAWIVSTRSTRVAPNIGMYTIGENHARTVPFCRL